MSKDSLPVDSEIFLNNVSFIDVRAPVEFAQGHLPNAINLPILTDEERALVGTVYKQQGNLAATALGHKLVSGEVKNQRVQLWLQHLDRNPKAVIYCFRGGQRSQIAQSWIAEAGKNRPRLDGGYKKARQFFLDQISEFSKNQELLVVSGPTGSGKTILLNELSPCPYLNLESLAKHRGSAFGAYETSQPSQANFENNLAVEIIRITASEDAKIKTVVEDESRMIGKISVPEIFFEKMRKSPVVWIEEPLETRVENIFQEYVVGSAIGRSLLDKTVEYHEKALKVFAAFKISLSAISKKLGGLKTSEIMGDLINSEQVFRDSGAVDGNKVWIEKLLLHYYDPLYLKSIERRKAEIIFRGSRKDCAAYLQTKLIAIKIK